MIRHPVILLAGGKSERLGRPKGLVVVAGEPWLALQIERLGECGASRVVVVLGHAWDEHVSALPWVARAYETGFPVTGLLVQVARNEEPERGPFSSLVCGIERLGAGEAAYVMPVDMPCPGRVVWGALEAAMTAEVDAAVPTHGGRGGHPLLCSARFLARLAALPTGREDLRLDAQVRGLQERARRRVAVDDVRVTVNLNTPEAWAAMEGGGEQPPR
jgi:molybdenum cofactor cytidylyltransferase